MIFPVVPTAAYYESQRANCVSQATAACSWKRASCSAGRAHPAQRQLSAAGQRRTSQKTRRRRVMKRSVLIAEPFGCGQLPESDASAFERRGWEAFRLDSDRGVTNAGYCFLLLVAS